VCSTAPAFSGWLFCLQLMWEVGLPHSPVEFSSHCHFYKLSCSWLLGVCCCSCLLRPGLLISSSVRDSPPPSSALRVPTRFATCLLCCYCLLFSFSFFPGWGTVCPGGYADLAQDCLWECHVPLSSPCGLHLLTLSGHWRLAAAWKPSWFLHLKWSGDALCRLEVWRSQSFASSQWFFL
jgi:hypothetical protein